MASTKMPLHVELDDGTEFDIVADLRDMRQWERMHKGRSFIEEPIDLGRMTFAAWSAARRAGLTTLSSKEFDLKAVDVSQPEDEDEDEDDPFDVDGELIEPGEVPPTPPAHGDASSYPSP